MSVTGFSRFGMVLEKADSGFVTEDIPLHAWILTRNGQSIPN
jgi:hypothetical protein